MKKIILILLLGLFNWAAAENMTQTNGYTIHHNALLTVDLSSQIAKQYHIRRSPHRALINISILKDQPGQLGQAVEASVKVTARNLRGQVRQIPLREIKEEDAIYYIGEFLVENGENINFDIDVVPEGQNNVLKASFQHQFFTTQ